MNDYSDYEGFTRDPEYLRLADEIAVLNKEVSDLERQQYAIRKPYEDARTNRELSQYGVQIGDLLLITEGFKQESMNNEHAWHVRDIIHVGDEAVVTGVASRERIVIKYGRERKAEGAWSANTVMNMRAAYLEKAQS